MGTYDKFPSTFIEDGKLIKWWNDIISELSSDKSNIIAVECYTGIYYSDLLTKIKEIPHTMLVDTSALFKSEEEILQMTAPFMKEDVLFGFLSNLSLADYFDQDKLKNIQQKIKRLEGEKRVIVVGTVCCSPLTE